MPNGYKHGLSPLQAGSVPLYDLGESRWGGVQAETRPASLTARVFADTSWGEVHYGFDPKGGRTAGSGRDTDDIDRLVRACAEQAALHGGQVDGTLFLDLGGCR